MPRGKIAEIEVRKRRLRRQSVMIPRLGRRRRAGLLRRCLLRFPLDHNRIECYFGNEFGGRPTQVSKAKRT
jgi:hypothetical protein